MVDKRTVDTDEISQATLEAWEPQIDQEAQNGYHTNAKSLCSGSSLVLHNHWFPLFSKEALLKYLPGKLSKMLATETVFLITFV